MDPRKYNGIDLWKFIMALFVVALHVRPLQNYNIFVINRLHNTIAAMAVPFFFLAAGFLLTKRMTHPLWSEKGQEIIRSYIKRILSLYLIWSAVYFPLAMIHYIDEKRSPLYVAFAYIRGLVLVGEHYNSWQLWYLLSTVYALLFVMFLLKHKQSIEKIVCIGFIIFLISILVTYLTENFVGQGAGVLSVLAKLFRYTINDGLILTGLFFIPAGMMLSRKKISPKISCIILLVSFALNFMIDNRSISTVLAAFSSIGLFKVVEEVRLKDSDVFFILRKMSTVIYLIHMLVWTAYYTVVYGEKTYGLDSFVFTVGVSSIIALGYVTYLKKRKENKIVI